MRKMIVLGVMLIMLMVTACNAKDSKETKAINEGVSQTATNGIAEIQNSEIQSSEIQNSEIVNENVEKMMPILRAITGFLNDEKSYNYEDDSKYWKALCMAENEYIRIYGEAVEEANFYKVSPEKIEELVYVIFPNRVDYKNVTIPTFDNVKYARYDEKQQAYYIAIGELGSLNTEVGNIISNNDGSLTVTINTMDLDHQVWNKTARFTLIKNEKVANSHFAYSIKDATLIK